MSMTVHTLASGSSGNCTLVSDEGVHILLDAGISCRRISKSLDSLGISISDLSGIFITHEHSDHISGLATICKNYEIPLFAAAPTARQICYRVPFADRCMTAIAPGVDVTLGALTVCGFATSHDSAFSMGFSVMGRRGKLCLATDLGYLSEDVLEAVTGCDLLIAETNHDLTLLEEGHYPYYLKQRIRSDRGHLCNEQGAELCRHAAQHGARTIILAHLSAENNTPAHARAAVETAFSAHFIQDVEIVVAPRAELSPCFVVA